MLDILKLSNTQIHSNPFIFFLTKSFDCIYDKAD